MQKEYREMCKIIDKKEMCKVIEQKRVCCMMSLKLCPEVRST